MLADSDTRWKWGALTARRLTAPGDGPGEDDRPVEISGLLLRGRATPTPGSSPRSERSAWTPAGCAR